MDTQLQCLFRAAVLNYCQQRELLRQLLAFLHPNHPLIRRVRLTMPKVAPCLSLTIQAQHAAREFIDLPAHRTPS